MNIYQLIILTFLFSYCAAPSEREQKTNDSEGNLGLANGAVSDGYTPACSRDMSDTTQPPQKPYVVFAFNACPAGTVPGAVVACKTKYVAANNANLSCTATGELVFEGLQVSMSGFGCFTPNQTSLIPGCDPTAQ